MVSPDELREILEVLRGENVASFRWEGESEEGKPEKFAISFMPEVPAFETGDESYDHNLTPMENMRKDLQMPPNIFPPRPAGYEVK